MSHEPRPDDTPSIDDKLDTHHRRQLSALVDGELAPDEARFLLRRLAHDDELSGRFERWQLCGDVLRGQVRRAAAPELGARIAAAIAATPAPASAPANRQPQPAARRRQAWSRWGGGAALAASLAAVAMFIGRPAATDPAQAPAPALAVQSLPATEAVLAEAAPVPAVAPVPQPTAAPVAAPVQARRTSPRMVASARVERAPAIDARQVHLADAGAQAENPVPASADPFASPEPLQARPWPRAVLAQPAGNSYVARFGEPAQAASFHPFEPRLSPPDGLVQPVPGAGEAPVPAPDPERRH